MIFKKSFKKILSGRVMSLFQRSNVTSKGNLAFRTHKNCNGCRVENISFLTRMVIVTSVFYVYFNLYPDEIKMQSFGLTIESSLF